MVCEVYRITSIKFHIQIVSYSRAAVVLVYVKLVRMQHPKGLDIHAPTERDILSLSVRLSPVLLFYVQCTGHNFKDIFVVHLRVLAY